MASQAKQAESLARWIGHVTMAANASPTYPNRDSEGTSLHRLRAAAKRWTKLNEPSRCNRRVVQRPPDLGGHSLKRINCK